MYLLKCVDHEWHGITWALISSHRKIVDKIDKDKDGKITAKELGDWIKFTRDQHNEENVNQRWKELIERVQGLKLRDDPASKETVDPNGPITWEEYKRAGYGEKPGIERSFIYSFIYSQRHVSWTLVQDTFQNRYLCWQCQSKILKNGMYVAQKLWHHI